VEVYEVAAETGRRIGEEPSAKLVVRQDGAWGPFTAKAGQHYEICLILNLKDLVKLHGLLIAFGWVEQNTGHVPTLQAGMVPACYRATVLGRRALADPQGAGERGRG
jgi:hypothetical protein